MSKSAPPKATPKRAARNENAIPPALLKQLSRLTPAQIAKLGATNSANPHAGTVERDSHKVIFRVSDKVWEAAEKWARRDGLLGVATAGRIAIIRVLRSEGLLGKDQH